MKRKLSVVLIAILILFTSCDLMPSKLPKPKMYLICCGLGYEDLANAELHSPNDHSIINPLNDSKAITTQFIELCKAGNYEYEIVCYSDDYHYANAKSISSIDESSTRRFTFTHISSSDNNRKFDFLNSTDHEFIANEDFPARFFGIINSMWNSAPTDNDMTLFYYSGHGANSLDNKNNAGLIIAYDTFKKKQVFLEGGKPVEVIYTYLDLDKATTLNYHALSEQLDKMKGRQLLILDCCYSGASSENISDILPMDTNELAYSLCFSEAYDIKKQRNDLKTRFKVGLFMTDSWNKTFDGIGGKPRRMSINASTYTQQAMNNDTPSYNDKGIEHYGGFTYKLLKYLGYQMTDKVETDKAMPPTNLNGKVITASNMMKAVYNSISPSLRKKATPNMTRSSYDMVIWDLR